MLFTTFPQCLSLVPGGLLESNKPLRNLKKQKLWFENSTIKDINTKLL